MSQQIEQNLGSGRVGKLLFKLAVPAITAQVVNALYNMVDRMYIGRIHNVSAQALTGVGVCMPVITVISAFAALATGGALRSSIKLGEGDREEGERILGNCTTMLAIISVVLTAVFLLTDRKLLMLFGASENTIGYALEYLQIYVCGTIFVQMTLGLNSFIGAQGFAKISMTTILIGAVCNIILDPVFIFGFEMGVRGAAVATVISQFISFAWTFKFVTSAKSILRLRKKNLTLSANVILPCIALGLSPFIMQSTESILTICFNTSLFKYGGDLEVGTMTILSSVMQFAFLPIQGLTQGSQPIISYNFGACKGERVKKTFSILILSALIYSTALWLIAMFAPQVYVMMFTGNPELIKSSVWAMRIYMSVSVLFSIQIVCQQTFIAIGNAKTSLFLAILRKIILLIPLIYILPNILSNKVQAVYLAEPISDFIAVATTATLFFIEFRNTMKNI